MLKIVCVLVILILQVFRARRRIVILAFANHAEDELKAQVEGFRSC
jgi:hypothetical protein